MGVLRRRWFQILVSGLVLLYLVERTLVATANPSYVPSVILLGAFLVPVTFTTYLYERLPNWDVPLPPLAICFLWGGVLGAVGAGTLEYDVARALGFLPKLLIGLIEESAKLLVPLVFYFLGRYRSEAAGIMLGVATAAGFAGLETMGYGFVSLLSSKGKVHRRSRRPHSLPMIAPAKKLSVTGGGGQRQPDDSRDSKFDLTSEVDPQGYPAKEKYQHKRQPRPLCRPQGRQRVHYLGYLLQHHSPSYDPSGACMACARSARSLIPLSILLSMMKCCLSMKR